MGRYYSGDIKGKFWFGVQSSDDASFFGVEPTEPEPVAIVYEFEKKDLLNVEAGIKKCEVKLGRFLIKLEQFFEMRDSYSDKILAKALGVPEGEAEGLLKWYARLILGRSIRGCLKKKGRCYFEGELQ